MRFLQTWFVLAMLSLGIAAKAEHGSAYIFGVVPQQSAVRMSQVWVPLLNHLAQKTGEPLRFSTAKDIPAFEKALAMGQYDFVYMNPYEYTAHSTASHRDHGYLAFARVRDKQIRGIIVVRKDSSIQSLAQLNGTILAMPAQTAFGASRVTSVELRNNGIQFTPKYVASHDSVYLNVVAGKMPAGTGVVRTFDLMPALVRNQLRILHVTKGYTPHAFAAHQRLPGAVVIKLQKAMLQLEHEVQGSQLLRKLVFNGIVAAQDSDWDDVRQDFPAPQQGNPTQLDRAAR